MAHDVPNPPPGFDGLRPEEQIEYVQALWDRIAAGPGRVGVPGWHERVVRERLAAYRANPAAGRDWDRLRADLRAQIDEAKER